MDSIQEKNPLHHESVDQVPPCNKKKSLLSTSIKLRKLRKHAWSITQNESYISFLQKHQHLMKDIYSRKINKIFRRMSEFVGTRSASQVKSHHQKLQMRYKTINRILIRVKQYIERLKNNMEMTEEDCKSFSPTDKTNTEVLVNKSESSDLPARYLGKIFLNQGRNKHETEHSTINWQSYFDFE